MITRRTLWQLLSSLPLIAAAANRGAARAPADSSPSPSGGPGMEMLTIFYPTYDYRALYKQEQSKNP